MSTLEKRKAEIAKKLQESSKAQASVKVVETAPVEEKKKETCDFCGKEFSDAKKHVRSCKDNPENKKAEIPTMDEIVNAVLARLGSNPQSDKAREISALVSDIHEIWADTLKSASMKRWKDSKGYLGHLKLFDTKIRSLFEVAATR